MDQSSLHLHLAYEFLVMFRVDEDVFVDQEVLHALKHGDWEVLVVFVDFDDLGKNLWNCQ